MVVWGLWQDGRLLYSTGSQSRKARNLKANPNCVVATEKAHEAVIVEGVAEIADVPARRKFLTQYKRKYHWDMSAMKDDVLSMKEPVFAVRPRVVFALWESIFKPNPRVGSSSRVRISLGSATVRRLLSLLPARSSGYELRRFFHL
jgi:Pyridoxamine 5'-phosphate oxidase